MPTKLFIGGLGDDRRISSSDLRPLFEKFGAVTECECIKNYAFVHMEDDFAARDALRAVTGTVVKGRTLRVELSGSKGPKKASHKIFVANIAEGTTDDELRTAFETCAPVLEAAVVKKYGFVHIGTDAGNDLVDLVLKRMNGYHLNGLPIRVELSTPSSKSGQGGNDECFKCGKTGHWTRECPSKRGSRFRGRDRTRSRSRSRSRDWDRDSRRGGRGDSREGYQSRPNPFQATVSPWMQEPIINPMLAAYQADQRSGAGQLKLPEILLRSNQPDVVAASPGPFERLGSQRNDYSPVPPYGRFDLQDSFRPPGYQDPPSRLGPQASYENDLFERRTLRAMGGGPNSDRQPGGFGQPGFREQQPSDPYVNFSSRPPPSNYASPSRGFGRPGFDSQPPVLKGFATEFGSDRQNTGGYPTGGLPGGQQEMFSRRSTEQPSSGGVGFSTGIPPRPSPLARLGPGHGRADNFRPRGRGRAF